MGEFILKVLEILLITYFNVLSNLFNDFLVKLKVFIGFLISQIFFYDLNISHNSSPSQCLNLSIKKRTLRVLFIRLDSGQLASENFQFGPSVRHSQELLTLIWCSNCYNPVPASPGHLTARQWMIKLQAELSLAGLNKEKLSEITLQSSLISDNKVGSESWDKLRTLYNLYHYYENFHSVYEYFRTPDCSMRGVSVSYRH